MRALFNLPAPAKINWFLHVTGRRGDGYHTLETVFQFIDWCDGIDLVVRDDGAIRRAMGDGLPEHDLCVRAATLLQQASGCRLGVDIVLRKSIPQQAGLGGGSSDAATVLLGLNRLWRLHLSRERLMQLALQLGADVPVFVFGRNAWAGGVGEALRPIDLPTPTWAVVHPARGLSTREVFGALDLTNHLHEETIIGFAEWLRLLDGGGFRPEVQAGSDSLDRPRSPESPKTPMPAEMWGVNDLQQAAEAIEPQVGLAARWLQARIAATGATQRFAARMSGSGSAVFAWVDGASGWLGGLPAGWQGRLCRGLGGHPLQRWIDA